MAEGARRWRRRAQAAAAATERLHAQVCTTGPYERPMLRGNRQTPTPAPRSHDICIYVYMIYMHRSPGPTSGACSPRRPRARAVAPRSTPPRPPAEG
eukprot:scaffold92955_cov45-Phaeocystis_antarctica.AAC.1